MVLSIHIERAFSEDGALDTPKSGHGRTVDLSQALSDPLQIHVLTLKEEKVMYAWSDIPQWLFVTKAGTSLDPANVRRAMLRVLKTAKLPEHFTPHCLRHTYASILLSEGVTPVYVQEQLGHATIELTVSTYGRWLKKKAPGALDRLDSVAEVGSGSKMVAEAGLVAKTALTPSEQEPYLQPLTMEPATRIERATCGLRNRCSTN